MSCSLRSILQRAVRAAPDDGRQPDWAAARQQSRAPTAYLAIYLD